MYLSLEGNIGSGKTTLFNILKTKYKNKIFIDEPIDEWQAIKNKDGNNILELFYSDPKKWSFSFQICALNTKLDKLTKIDFKQNYVMSERSILTDKYCFAKQLHEDNYIGDIDWILYNNCFKNIKSDLYPKAIIYLKCSPDICFDRIHIRNRNEESNITLDYLTKLNYKHSEWLSEINIPVLEINANENYLENDAMMNDMLKTIEEFLCKF